MSDIQHLRVVEHVDVGEVAHTAAVWWADHLRALPGAMEPTDPTVPNRSALGRYNNQPAESLELDGRKLNPELINRYEYHLGIRIQHMLDDMQDPTDWLHCDMGPGLLHVFAMNGAGFYSSTTMLPWKTRMLIKDGEIYVTDGYGTPYRQIYPAGASEPPAAAIRDREQYIRSLTHNPPGYEPEETDDRSDRADT